MEPQKIGTERKEERGRDLLLLQEQFKGREDSSGVGGGGEEGEIAFRGGFPLLSPHAEGSLKLAEKKRGKGTRELFSPWV